MRNTHSAKVIKEAVFISAMRTKGRRPNMGSDGKMIARYLHQLFTYLAEQIAGSL